MKRIAVLASGHGTLFEFVVRGLMRDAPHIVVSALITDRKSSGAAERASSMNIPVIVIGRKEPERYRYNLMKIFTDLDCDLFVLAGFLGIIPSEITEKFSGRIINSHPALLPCFGGMGYYGLKVHQHVIDSGAKVTGCTVHFVTGKVDGGPIIAQRCVEVHDDDTAETLSERVKDVERPLLLHVIISLLSGRASVSGNRVTIE